MAKDWYDYPAVVQPDNRILVLENCERTQETAACVSLIGRLMKSPGNVRIRI